jgi:hypothetical protein
VQPVVASTTANAPAAVNVAALKLDSNPSGAAVMTKEGKMLCSSTPCEVKFEGEDAKEDKEHVFVFSKGGFKDTVETVKVSDKTFTAKLVSP